ncbi:MAG: CDGSH iron-sulfur domain-containing protein, partial [Gemmatimonadetes bacterium]|nr:CDGSH iron-sulfur domain-containing protein [Gemmatimonadota bacterium]NIQ53563.1 CDGSH iron-sulfur domain-containing protein [Gemmatimonadota bacterium]NIU73723.1 CDGSH iron-sulfur domain-containing protein [Gammaproteobacteria bacterium]NIX43909.1 CDGSH iron-sulfur domain-containing protein [Gemmatimonadota bacterium]
RVDGAMELCDADGNRIETQDGKPFFLCRCGQSANKPFCDGTHNRTDWDPALAERG